MTDEQNAIMQSLKEETRLHVEKLLAMGVRNVNIEIEMLSYIKEVVYPERQHKS